MDFLAYKSEKSALIEFGVTPEPELKSETLFPLKILFAMFLIDVKITSGDKY